MRTQKKLNLKESIFIVGEGITEQYYFSHLKSLNAYSCTVKPRFFGKTSIMEIDKSVQKLLSGGVSVICVFDADVSERNLTERERLNQFKRKYIKNADVLICDSLPSIEFWFLLHFAKTNRYFPNSKEAEKELKNFITDYCKAESYLKNRQWVVRLAEKMEVALLNSKALEKCDGRSYSNMYKAIEKLVSN